MCPKQLVEEKTAVMCTTIKFTFTFSYTFTLTFTFTFTFTFALPCRTSVWVTWAYLKKTQSKRKYGNKEYVPNMFISHHVLKHVCVDHNHHHELNCYVVGDFNHRQVWQWHEAQLTWWQRQHHDNCSSIWWRWQMRPEWHGNDNLTSIFFHGGPLSQV